MTRDVHVEVLYPNPIEDVWHHITDAETLGSWLMPNDLQAVAGHEFTFRTTPRPGFSGIVSCRVIEADAPRKLVYSWDGGFGETLVTWILTLEAEGTRLTLDHTGFTGVRGMLLAWMLGAGWKKKLKAIASSMKNQTRSADTHLHT